MKLCPMIVQALWEFKSPLLQLPHVTDENLKYFMNKKRHVKTLQQLAQLKNDDRRQLLRHLTDDEYHNVIKVLGNMPYIDFKIQHEGKMLFKDRAEGEVRSIRMGQLVLIIVICF